MSLELKKIQQWYLAHCDGDWEHGYGVKIETLDNPGWWLGIELAGTELEKTLFESTEIERTENDWIHCKLEGTKFKAYGGPENLEEMIYIFLEWAEGSSEG